MRVTASFATARERNHAESTHIVATASNRNKGSYAVSAQSNRTQIRISFVFGKNDVDGVSSVFHVFEQIRQITVSIGPNNQIDDFFFFEEFGFETFRHTAQNADF